MSIKIDKSRITAIIDKTLEEDVIKFAEKEKRTKSSMAAILIEEAICNRIKRGGNLDD